jgi:hypothetical protein
LRIQPKRLGTKEAEMKIVGCDLHARQQTIAMMSMETGEFTEKTLSHEGNAVREFYAGLEGPVVVGIEATGAMQWFLEIAGRVGHRVSGRTSGEDSSPRDTEAEARSPRLRFVINVAERSSVSRDLDAVGRTAKAANPTAGP